MNYIFGSGLVGLLAKTILGPSWTVVPFYKSRFFSFNPALDDNFIIRDDRLDDFIKEIKNPLQYFVYRKAWSINGQIINNYDEGLCGDWLYKTFGSGVPPQSKICMANKMDFLVYDIRLNELYNNLLRLNIASLKEESAKGLVTEVGDHYFIRNGVRVDFDHLVNTIPLNALHSLMGAKHVLEAKAVHFYHIATDSLDFEKSNQLLVADNQIGFFKVTNVGANRYLFYCHEDIPLPGPYFMKWMPKFDILDGTSIENYLPLGPAPKLDALEAKDIFCIGSYAQWDWCMDMASCILRIMKYSQRNLKSATKSVVLE